jgi:hypothetical protein
VVALQSFQPRRLSAGPNQRDDVGAAPGQGMHDTLAEIARSAGNHDG